VRFIGIQRKSLGVCSVDRSPVYCWDDDDRYDEGDDEAGGRAEEVRGDCSVRK